LFSRLKIVLRLLFMCHAVFLWSSAVSCGFQAYQEDGNKQTDPPLCVVVRKKIVPLNLHVCMPMMPFSAHFYVLLTQFTLSLYFAVSLITNMLFSIHSMLVSANFTRRNHLPIAQRTLRDHLPMHSYTQLLSKLLPSLQNGGGAWGGGRAPSPRK